MNSEQQHVVIVQEPNEEMAFHGISKGDSVKVISYLYTGALVESPSGQLLHVDKYFLHENALNDDLWIRLSPKNPEKTAPLELPLYGGTHNEYYLPDQLVELKAGNPLCVFETGEECFPLSKTHYRFIKLPESMSLVACRTQKGVYFGMIRSDRLKHRESLLQDTRFIVV